MKANLVNESLNDYLNEAAADYINQEQEISIDEFSQFIDELIAMPNKFGAVKQFKNMFNKNPYLHDVIDLPEYKSIADRFIQDPEVIDIVNSREFYDYDQKHRYRGQSDY